MNRCVHCALYIPQCGKAVKPPPVKRFVIPGMAARIKEAMAKADKTPAQVVRELALLRRPIRQGPVYRMAQGAFPETYRDFEEFARAIGVSAEYLLVGEKAAHGVHGTGGKVREVETVKDPEYLKAVRKIREMYQTRDDDNRWDRLLGFLDGIEDKPDTTKKAAGRGK